MSTIVTGCDPVLIQTTGVSALFQKGAMPQFILNKPVEYFDQALRGSAIHQVLRNQDCDEGYTCELQIERHSRRKSCCH